MEPSPQDTVRDAVSTLLMAALHDLADRDGVPRIGAIADRRNWWRHGQESFVALRPTAWHMPERVTTVGWLSTFSEMVDVRTAIEADPILASRVDTMVGTEFAMNQRPLEWMLVEHLLEPVIVATRRYTFDADVFDAQFTRLDTGLRTDNMRFVEYVPLNGFTSSMSEIALADDVVARPMTDRQISRAIQVLAVPAAFSGGPNSVQVSRFHQWAVMRERGYPVRSGRHAMPEHPHGPRYPSLEEPAQRLVTALRIVCGGSVVATRPIHAQHDDDYPPTVEGSAALSAVAAADISRPTQVLTDAQVEAVRDVYESLAASTVCQDRSVQVAVRRFVFAGSRAEPEDRLVDLVICCEALFLKRHNVRGTGKAASAAKGAGQLLAGDRVVRTEGDRVERFVRAAYRLRNAVVHGDHPERRPMTLLHGATTHDLALFVEDFGLLVGRALHLVLGELARPAAAAEVTR